MRSEGSIMAKTNFIWFIFGTTLVTNCAHHRDVRPSESGIHSVVLTSDEENTNYQNARSQAEDYCETFEQKYVVVSEDTKYIGEGSEQDYKRNKKFADMAKVAGSGAMVFGGKVERRGGAAVGLGGLMGDAYLGDGYLYELKFKCKK
jgi:hypothetical protein